MAGAIKYSLTLLVLLFSPATLLAQQQAYNWYFGFDAGLTFKTPSPSPLQPIPTLNSSYYDITSAASDAEGNLLFVTDGARVFTKEGKLMENGDLHPGGGAISNTLVIPKPGDEDNFFILTISQRGNSISLKYAEVDMSQGNGLGRVISKQHELFSKAFFRLAAVMHCNGRDIWVMTMEASTNRFYAFLVTDTGIRLRPVISSAGQPQNAQFGDLKFSPNGTKLATVGRDHDSQVLNFDAKSGQVTTGLRIPKDMFGSDVLYASYYHSASFSPDNTKLYVSSGSWWAEDGRCAKLSQFDLEATDILGSHYAIYDNSGSPNSGPYGCRTHGVGDIQIGPDGRLYIANYDREYLHVVTNPNAKGADLNFIFDGAYLGGGRSSWRLPNFVESLFNEGGLPKACPAQTGEVTFSFQKTCFSQATSFRIDFQGQGPFSVEWDFGDPGSGADNGSTELNPSHTFSSPGTFRVSLSLYSMYDNSHVKTITKEVTILPATPVELGPDRLLCGSERVTLDAFTATALSYKWSDGSTGPTLEVGEPGQYWVEVNQGDCILKDSVLVSRRSQITASIGQDTVLCTGAILFLDATSPGATYSWSNGSKGAMIEVSTPGTYEVIISNRCFTSRQAVTVGYVDCQKPEPEQPEPGIRRCSDVNQHTIPNIFTPNNDGKNDYFGLAETAGLPGYTLEIYDRWGRKVFESSQGRTVWDGKGSASGAYFYLMRFQCGEGKRVEDRVIKGSLTLTR